MEKKYLLEGLDCANCAQKIERALNDCPFIHKATINFATTKCMIEYEEYSKENEDTVIQLIQKIEDEVQVIPLSQLNESSKECSCEHHHHEHEHEECGCGHEHHEHEHAECGCGHHHHEHEHEECECGHEHHEHEHAECGCGHHHHEHEHEECGCGHEHHEHEHAECGCGHHHHEHEHEECGCGHEHHEHEHAECGCGHHHHEHEHEECECGHHHHEHEHEECGCGHHHHEHEHEECGCGHHHHEHEHEECGCGHHHHEHEQVERKQANNDSTKVRWQIEGLDCAHCALKVEDAVNKVEGVDTATLNFTTKTLVFYVQKYQNVETVKENVKAAILNIEPVEIIEGKQASKDSIKVKWQIEGLDCAHCALKVEDAVNKVEGVEMATLNFTTKTLMFYVKKHQNIHLIKENVKAAILNIEQVDIIEGKDSSEKRKSNKYAGIWLGLPLLVLGLFLSNSILLIISYFCIGSHVILKAAKNIKRGQIFDENFLMMIATLGAIVVGEYVEAIAVMLFYQIGEYFQDKAVEKSRKSIADLMDIQSEVAHLVSHDEIKDVHPDNIFVGDVILVKPGERIPLDGTVIEGEGSLDTSALTGESYPSSVSKGSDVLSGCINLNGLLKIKVSKIASESAVSRILDLVENAASKKAKTELKMTKFARIYTPIVVFAALAVAVLPNFFNTGIEWNEWLIRACTFLVISCPCALVLSIPLGYYAGIGASSRNGILVKGGNYLEVLNEIETVVFDKTGTLTTGTFSVQQVISNESDRCLEIAALAESYSTHPIATSIMKAYGKEIDSSRIKHVEEIAGHGIKAVIDGKTVIVGNKKMMETEHVEVAAIQSIGTLVYVAVNQQYVGTLEISDSLKPTTKQALQELKQNGIKKLVMLSGDRNNTAQAIGKEVGIDEVHAQLLPTDKVSEIEKILNNQTNGKVAFVGDGINDAPVLARCDLGIAMGGLGSEAAIEAADIVLMKDDLTALNKGIKIARKTQHIMNQNIFFILLIKFLVLGLSIFGYANMWLGVFADVGVSLLAVLNAMRILESK